MSKDSTTMKHLLTLLLFAHSFVGLAKLTRVPFPMKVAQSALIIEGEVTSKTPTLGKDGRIYEINVIQISQVFKNESNLSTSHLEPGVYLVSSSDGLWRTKLIKL